jgi:hypothetical protein
MGCATEYLRIGNDVGQLVQHHDCYPLATISPAKTNATQPAITVIMTDRVMR